jgi:peptide subunit release factor 1 (eRF1)
MGIWLAAQTDMAKTSPALDTPLRNQLERLAAFEPQDVPVVSLYLNLTADQHGRDNYEVFVRKAFAEHLKAFKESSAERASLERDVERIEAYLSDEVNRSRNGLALFASAGAGEFFEAIQFDAPLDEHWLVIGAVPHLYPLARIIDQYPRYASVLLDTQQARIFVFSLGGVEKRQQITGVKTRRTSMGGWSQARYQRRAENFHLQHVKEVVDTLERIVRADNIQHVIVAGDAVVIPLLKEQLPQHLLDKLVDVLTLERDAGENEIIQATLEALKQKDAETDAERVAELVDAWQSGGLGVVGPEATLDAFQLGQVDELVIAGKPQELKLAQNLPADAAPAPIAVETSEPVAADMARLKLANELVARAQQTGATVRFIEDPGLLEEFGGVGAFLRFRLRR